jgi:hypothetical protein
MRETGRETERGREKGEVERGEEAAEKREGGRGDRGR